MSWLKNCLKRSSLIVKVYESIVLKVNAARRQFVRVVIKRPKTKHSYGKKNRNKTFFVIPAWEKSGLYSSILLAMPVMEYAIKRGFVPVLDFKNTYNGMMQDIENKGLENSWEYYYEQPGKVSLEEVYQSKKVIHYSKEAYYVRIPAWNSMLPCADPVLQHWHKFIVDNFHLQKPLEERVEQVVKRLFAGKEKILGVGVRAAFRAMYLAKNPIIKGHPVVPTCEEMIQIVEAKMMEWGCRYIFLSIDDREYHQKFVDYFADKCLFLERHLSHWFIQDVPLSTENDIEEILREYEGVSVREKTEEYLVETYLLSKCDSICINKGGGAQFAYFLNGGRYEHVDIYNEGEYCL